MGALATQWQQMLGSLKRVEQETVTSQNLANAIENMLRTLIDATGNRLRLKDGERLYPKSCSAARHSEGLHVRSLLGWDTLV